VTANVCYRPIVTNPRVSGAGDIGIRLFHAGTGLVEDAQIIGGVIRDCATMGMLIDERVSGATVVGTRIVDCGNYGVTVVNSANVNKLVGVTATGAVLTDIRNLNINTLLIGTEVIDGRQGPFTPQILTGGTAVGRTYSTQSGQYRVNGNCVEFSLSIVLTAAGSSTGNMTISGLPFLSAATGPFSQVSPQYAQLTLLGTGFNVFGLILNAANAISLFQVESAAGSTALTETALAANTEIYISGRYFI